MYVLRNAGVVPGQLSKVDKEALEEILFTKDSSHTMKKYYKKLEDDETSDTKLLDSLSILFASTRKTKKSKMGNVCIAMASDGKNLFIASNVNDGAGIIPPVDQQRITCEKRLFLQLFETDFESRYNIISNEKAKSFIPAASYKDFTDRDKFKMVFDELNNKTPLEKNDATAFDSVISSFAEIKDFWDRISESKNSEFALTMLLLEFIALSSSSANTTLFDAAMASMVDVVLQYTVAMHLKVFLDTQCEPLTGRHEEVIYEIRNLERTICDLFKSKVAGNYPFVKQLAECVMQLNDYEKISYITAEDTNKDQVLHCEIKLYLYLKQISRPTKIAFSISKPLCMDCAMYFFSSVKSEDRPIFKAACTDHFPKVFYCWPCVGCDIEFGEINVAHFGCRNTENNHAAVTCDCSRTDGESGKKWWI